MKHKIPEKWNAIPVMTKASLAYLICSIIQKCLGIITLPLFTRLLSTEQYGQVTVYASWSSIISIFLTLQMPYGTFSRAMVKYENNRDEYIASAEGILLVIFSVFLCLYIPFRKLWNNLFELPTPIMIIMGLEIVVNAGVAFWSGKKRFEFRYKEVIAYTIFTSLTSILLQFILVNISEEKGYARILGGAIVTILCGGYVFVKNAIGNKLFNKDYWSYALGFSIPLLLYYLSQAIFNSSDRIMISHLVGTDKAAIYGVAYNLAFMLNFVLNSINNSYSPWIYSKLKENRQDENIPIANAIAILLAFLLLGVIWLAPEIIWIFAGEQYSDAIWVIPPVAMSVMLLFYSQLPIYIEFYFEKKTALVVSSIGAAIINVFLNTIFIPILGYYAAGYTTMFSYIVFVIANYFSMKRIARENDMNGHGFDTHKLIIILGVFLTCGFIGMIFYNYPIIRLMLIMIIGSILFLSKRKIALYWRKSKGTILNS